MWEISCWISSYPVSFWFEIMAEDGYYHWNKKLWFWILFSLLNSTIYLIQNYSEWCEIISKWLFWTFIFFQYNVNFLLTFSHAVIAFIKEMLKLISSFRDTGSDFINKLIRGYYHWNTDFWFFFFGGHRIMRGWF